MAVDEGNRPDMTGGRTRIPDRRVQRTQRLLQRALLDLVMERDYDRITVQDILDRADVGRSTFYAHFRNKDHLLLGDFGVAAFQEAAPRRRVPSWLGLLEHLEENYGLYKALSGTEGLPLALDRLRESVERVWRDLLRAREAKAGDSVSASEATAPRATARFLTGAVMDTILWWLEARMPCTAEELNRMLEWLTAGALAAAAGQGVESRPREEVASLERPHRAGAAGRGDEG